MDWRARSFDWNRARAFLATAVGEAEPLVRRALPDPAPIAFPIWLAAHREVNASRRVRLVFDMLAGALADL